MTSPPTTGQPATPAGTGRPKRTLALDGLVVISGLTGYLALLGGLLLAIRFWHLGIPISASLALVPPSQLVSTAMTELLALPVMGASLLAALYGVGYIAAAAAADAGDGKAPASPRAGAGEARGLLRRGAHGVSKAVNGKAINVVVVVSLTLIVPLNAYGLAMVLAYGVPLLLADQVAGKAAALAVKQDWSGQRVAAGLFAVLAVLAMLPVLARQAVDPAKAETVNVIRRGRPALTGHLITVRENAVVLARCGRLRIVPTPLGLRIDRKPPDTTDGRSILERALGATPSGGTPAVDCRRRSRTRSR